MEGDYRAEGCDVLYSGPGGEVCIASGSTTLWSRHIATALNYWDKSNRAENPA